MVTVTRGTLVVERDSPSIASRVYQYSIDGQRRLSTIVVARRIQASQVLRLILQYGRNAKLEQQTVKNPSPCYLRKLSEHIYPVQIQRQ